MRLYEELNERGMFTAHDDKGLVMRGYLEVGYPHAAGVGQAIAVQFVPVWMRNEDGD